VRFLSFFYKYWNICWNYCCSNKWYIKFIHCWFVLL